MRFIRAILGLVLAAWSLSSVVGAAAADTVRSCHDVGCVSVCVDATTQCQDDQLVCYSVNAVTKCYFHGPEPCNDICV